MREIQFRGRDEQGRWHFGMLRVWRDQSFAIETTQGLAVDFVDPDTVGQFTGHCDVMGKEMYEGDIISGYFEEDEWPAVVEWDEVTASFILEGQCSQIRFDEMGGLEIEIVGNIHDNPELMEGKL